MGEIWGGPATDDTFGFHLGNVTLVNVHDATECAGEFCVFHNPSSHHMRDWPTLWRADRRMMERTCSHGVGHPDPDDLAYHERNGRSWMGIHGCDLNEEGRSCCEPPEDRDG
jgi:hypothetical protein